MLTEFQLCRKREKKAMARKYKGYRPTQFLTPLTQRDIKALPPSLPPAYQEAHKNKPSIVGRAVSFCRRMLGR